jgi:predicted amidohydrolase
MQDLNISLIQCDLHWEDRDRNLDMISALLEKLVPGTDLIVLPEMFSTGFSMNTKLCAEQDGGYTLDWMKEKAASKSCVLTGSVMIRENFKLVNRLYWVYPDGRYQFYDKRHLFRFGREDEHYQSGSKRIITEAGGWKFCPLICYDLRFPVWSRNKYVKGDFEYDCLLYVANWPERRAHHWKSLLVARAIENLSYCVAVNRVGNDGNGLSHSGNSMVVDPLGQITHKLEDHQAGIIQATLAASTLLDWRQKFNAALDWDEFVLR